MSEQKFYITTAIDYASGSPHIGHAYEKISADVLARWKRDNGFKCFFLTGTDEHGQKIVDKAKESGLTVENFVKQESDKFEVLCDELSISNDYFIRTTNSDHKLFVQKMLQKSFDNGDIYLGNYEGLYCVGCEQYYGEDDLLEGSICPTHKTKCVKFNEENYFFKLSKYQDRLLDLYDGNLDFILPENRKEEVKNRVKEGLRDISISRKKKNLSWGVELPFDKDHVSYVWFDALFNYLSALDKNNKLDFWPADVQLLGKDIMWFHMVYWPAFLMSVGLDTPKKIFAHGMILDSQGHKMSKSIGNVVSYKEMIQKFGVDELRFFILSLGSYGEDLNFSEDQFIQKINNDLNNDLGNLVSRVHSMTQRYFKGAVPEKNILETDDVELIQKLNFHLEFDKQISNLRFNHAIDILWDRIRETNAYINKVSPWKVQDEKRLATIINILCSSIKLFSSYLNCFIPSKNKNLRSQFNFNDQPKFNFEHINKGHVLGSKENLFEKVKLKKKENLPDKPSESENFSSLNLKVGKIEFIEKVKNSNKLYRIEVNLGSEKRQILSGLQQLYKEDELLNKKVIVLSNLKPAKMAGLDSNGMILAAEDEKHNCGLLLSDLDVGSNIKCGDEIANSSKEIKIKTFLKIKMISNGKNISLDENLIEGVSIDRNIKGNVC